MSRSWITSALIDKIRFACLSAYQIFNPKSYKTRQGYSCIILAKWLLNPLQDDLCRGSFGDRLTTDIPNIAFSSDRLIYKRSSPANTLNFYVLFYFFVWKLMFEFSHCGKQSIHIKHGYRSVCETKPFAQGKTSR